MSDAQAPIEYHRASSYGQDADFLVPKQWIFDGDYRRRAPVLDSLNGNRVARLVGYKRCLICKKPFFSPDVKNIYICGAYHSPYESE
jgi:hypothetical protein